MRLLQDGVIAMLAAIGLSTILWAVITLFYRRKKPVFPHVTALVSAGGDGEDLEYTVRTLAQLRWEQGTLGGILIVDCGLSPEGRELAGLLSREEDCVALCRREDLSDYFH